MKTIYSQEDMAALINEIETSFSQELKKAEEAKLVTIQKSEEAKEEANVVVEVAPEAKIETPTEEVVKSEPVANVVEDTIEYTDEDYADVDSLYGSMEKAELEAHYQSIKKTLFTDNKETVKTDVLPDLTKSEEFINLKKENEDLKKSVESITAALAKMVMPKVAPARKAITEIQYIKKSEAETVKTDSVDISKLTPKTISDTLNAKIREGKLTKSERECINDYYNGSDRSLDKIKHLL